MQKINIDTKIPAIIGKGHLSPYAIAKRTWDSELSGWTFESARDIIMLTGGVFYCTPTYFLMAKAICKDDKKNRLNIHHEFPMQEVDCWHIWLMAGSLKLCWLNYPFPLPYVSWENTNRFRVYEMRKVRQHIMRKI